MGETVEQRELVERARRGDHDAFAQLAAGAVTRLDAAARLILRDRELARDAVQEALVRAWRDLPGLRDPDRFDAWLHRLIVRACIDQARIRSRRPIEVEIDPILDAPTPDESQAIVDRDQIDRVLAHLTPEHRALVVLHYYLELPLPEAAGLLGIPLGTAKSRLHRAIGSLRRTLGPDSHGIELEGGRLA
jgi:RNA polymerase sigma-70 factor (ECF subfamily)